MRGYGHFQFAKGTSIEGAPRPRPGQWGPWVPTSFKVYHLYAELWGFSGEEMRVLWWSNGVFFVKEWGFLVKEWCFAGQGYHDYLFIRYF